MKIEALQTGYPEGIRHMPVLTQQTRYRPNMDRVEIQSSKTETKETFSRLMKSIHGITFL